MANEQTQATGDLSPEKQKKYEQIILGLINDGARYADYSNYYTNLSAADPSYASFVNDQKKGYDTALYTANRLLAINKIDKSLPQELTSLDNFNTIFGPGFQGQLNTLQRQSTERMNEAQRQLQIDNAGRSNWARQTINDLGIDFDQPIKQLVFDRLSASNAPSADIFRSAVPQAAQQPAPQPTPQVTAPAFPTPIETPAQVNAPAPLAPQEAPVAQTTAAPVTQAPVMQAPVAQQIPSSNFLSAGIPVGISATQPTAQPTAQPVTTSGTTPMATALSPESLPELRSAGGGGTSAIDPTLRPYLELGLRAAEQQFLQTQPQFFPGQTYVSPSQQTLDALAAQEQIARAAPSTLQAAQESYMRGMGGLGATAGGAFLMGNPYQQQMIEAASRPIMQQFTQQTLPGIASGFSGAGRYGSGAMERALGQATEATSRALGDVGTNIAFQDYSAERGRQQQAILGQITAAGQAPAIYGQQFLPGQQLAQIGAAREAIASLPLQEQMQRFSFAQQAPRESLNAFLSSVYGTPMARSQYAPTPETQTNRAASAFGLGALGAGIGSMIGGQTGAFGYTTPQLTAGGAALGALGGLLL